MALDGHIYDEIWVTNDLLRKLIAEQRNANATFQSIAAALATQAGHAEPQSPVVADMRPDAQRFAATVGGEMQAAIDRAAAAPRGSGPNR
jgi:hypothetical protein